MKCKHKKAERITSVQSYRNYDREYVRGYYYDWCKECGALGYKKHPALYSDVWPPTKWTSPKLST